MNTDQRSVFTPFDTLSANSFINKKFIDTATNQSPESHAWAHFEGFSNVLGCSKRTAKNQYR